MADSTVIMNINLHGVNGAKLRAERLNNPVRLRFMLFVDGGGDDIEVTAEEAGVLLTMRAEQREVYGISAGSVR